MWSDCFINYSDLNFVKKNLYCDGYDYEGIRINSGIHSCQLYQTKKSNVVTKGKYEFSVKHSFPRSTSLTTGKSWKQFRSGWFYQYKIYACLRAYANLVHKQGTNNLIWRYVYLKNKK